MNINYKYVTDTLNKKAVELRREFHSFPEEGFCEYRTSARIADILKNLGYEVFMGERVCRPQSRMGVPSDDVLKACEERAAEEGVSEKYLNLMQGGLTGVIGIIRGSLAGGVTALRFDIDALPVTEKTGQPFSSLHTGSMHACGHDGHTSIGLTVAEILAENRDRLKGEVRLIFQPAEEGARGARAVAANGWLDDVSEFLSGHIGLACTKTGQIGACSGGFMATTKFNITFKGVAAHAGKAPELGRNALLAAADFTVAVQSIPKTGIGSTRVNVGRLIGGSARNIIADRAYLEMETRGSNTQADRYMQQEVRKIADETSKKYDVSYEIECVGSSENASSDPEYVSALKAAAEQMGLESMYFESMELGASEDAAILMNQVRSHGGKAAYFMFGSELKADHHQCTFDFNEEVLRIAAEFYSRAVLDR